VVSTDANQPAAMLPPAAVILWIHPELTFRPDGREILAIFLAAINDIRHNYGVPVPGPVVQFDAKLQLETYVIEAHGVRIGSGKIAEQDKPTQDEIQCQFSMALRRQLPLFLGIQETATLVNKWALEYPDLVKETLRAVAPQRLTEVLRRLLKEEISIRNMRDIFEAITDAATREKDAGLLVEQVRLAIRRQLGDQYGGVNRLLFAILVHPELEDLIHQSMRNTSAQSPVVLSPKLYQSVVQNLHQVLQLAAEKSEMKTTPVLLCSPEVRRHLRSLLEDEFFELPVLSYQELTGDLRIQQIGQINT
jgi:type III secretion protein V